MTIPIGTKVVMIHDPQLYVIGNEGWLNGNIGEVIIDREEGFVGVKFDKYDYNMHTLSGNVERGYGYWVSSSVLHPIDEHQSIEDLL